MTAIPPRGSSASATGCRRRAASEPQPGDPLLTLLHGVAGFAALAGTIVLLGATFFLTVLWRQGLALSRSRRLLVLAWAVAAVGTAALFVLERPFGASRPAADVADESLLGVTFGTLYGKLLLLRLVALGAAAAVWWAARRRARAPGAADVGGLAFLVVESFSFGGHAGQGSWVPLAATMDALHLAAASVWLGGLVVLGSVLLAPPRDARPAADLEAVLPALVPRRDVGRRRARRHRHLPGVAGDRRLGGPDSHVVRPSGAGQGGGADAHAHPRGVRAAVDRAARAPPEGHGPGGHCSGVAAALRTVAAAPAPPGDLAPGGDFPAARCWCASRQLRSGRREQ